MALSTQIASSSHALAEPPPRWKFDVFLSFRGQDTRRGFISHLYNKLQCFKTFIDDQLEIGSEISPELSSAIEHSHLAIVVISPNYASSTWCLDELANIIESMNPRDKRILPVFLNVDPSDVRYQKNSFAEAFAKHEVKFRNDPNKVERWRQALTKVANLAGYDDKNYKCESVLIENIVKRVWEKVRPTITSYNSDEKLVGIDFGLGQMGLRLAPEEKDVRFQALVLESSFEKKQTSLPPLPSFLRPPVTKVVSAGSGDIGGFCFLDEVGGGKDVFVSCTESLGFESSNEIMGVDNQVELSLMRKCENKRSQWRRMRDKRPVDKDNNKFPPPILSLNKNGHPNFYLRPVRKDGRLELTEVRIHRPEILRAHRKDGRLRLHLISHDQEQEEDIEEE